MACYCTDLIDDLEAKFELIYDLAETLLELILSRRRGGGGGDDIGGGGGRARIRQDMVRIIRQWVDDGQDVVEMMKIILASGIFK